MYRHGLWAWINRLKQTDYSYREVWKNEALAYFYSPTVNKYDLAIKLCNRAFRLFKMKTVGEWNDLCKLVGSRIYTHASYRDGQFAYIRSPKKHWPVKFNGHTYVLKYSNAKVRYLLKKEEERRKNNIISLKNDIREIRSLTNNLKKELKNGKV